MAVLNKSRQNLKCNFINAFNRGTELLKSQQTGNKTTDTSVAVKGLLTIPFNKVGKSHGHPITIRHFSPTPTSVLH